MIDNPLLMNDWNIRKFLYVVIAVQAAVLGLIILSTVGVDIPFLRYVVGFIYLAFIPGIIVLRILRLHTLGTVRTLLHSVGISLAFNMFLGFIINFLYPYFGISKPLSTVPIIITWTVVLGILCFVCYRRDSDYNVPVQFELRNLISPIVLLFPLLPLVAILGAQLVNSYNNNMALLLLIAVISLAPILFMATRLVPENYYPFIIWMISISVLFHCSLISNNIYGWDIRLEYYMYKVVATNNVWSSLEPLHPYNAVLSVTILPLIYNLVLNLEGTWIFKVIFPLFFSLVPVALFEVFETQLGKKRALLSVFYFIAVSTFFTTMLQLGKQMMAEFFFSLFLLALLDDKLGSVTRRILIISFGVGIVVAHYSTAYLFVIVMVFGYIISTFLRNGSVVIPIALAFLFIVISVCWYMYNSGGLSFTSITLLGKSVYDGLSEVFFDPMSRYSLYLVTVERLPLHEILKYLYIMSQFFIVCGFIPLFVKWVLKKSISLTNEYMGFSTALFIFLVFSAVLPRFSGVTDILRSFHMSLFLLAPFCIYGYEMIAGQAKIILLKLRNKSAQLDTLLLDSNNSFTQFSIFLCILFVFSTGFIYEVFNDPIPTSIAISRDKVENPIYSKRDEKAAYWLMSSRSHDTIIYYDANTQPLLQLYLGVLGKGDTQVLSTDSVDDIKLKTELLPDDYVLLREFNVKTGRLNLFIDSRDTLWLRGGSVRQVDLISLTLNDILQHSNIIYDNKGAVIYQTRESR